MSARVIGAQFRTSDRTAGSMRGVRPLTEAITLRLGAKAILLGEVSLPKEGDWENDLKKAHDPLVKLRDRLSQVLDAGFFPIVITGECSTGLATIPLVMARNPGAQLLWLDAHGDFNTPQTTKTQFLGGMALAGACGLWETGFEGNVAADNVILAGVRDLDSWESVLLRENGVTVIPPGPGLLPAVIRAVSGHPVYVHLDWDVLNPSSNFPTEYKVPGGPLQRGLRQLFLVVTRTSPVIGLEMMEFEGPEKSADMQHALIMALDMLEPMLAGHVVKPPAAPPMEM